LNALKVAIPDGYKVNVDHGYEVWKSHRHRKHTRYWIRILDSRDFNSLILRLLLKCPGPRSLINSPDDSGDEEDTPLLPAGSVIEKLESIAVQHGLSEEQESAHEDLKRRWTAQRQPPSEDRDVVYFERYRDEKFKNARNIKAWKEHLHGKGLGKQYLNVVTEILKKNGNPRQVLEDDEIGRIVSYEDGNLSYFLPDWNSPRAGPALESFLEVLENEQAQAYSELHSLEFDKFLEIAALEEDEYEAREASAFAMEKKKVDTQLKAIQHKIQMIEGKGGPSPEKQERLRQLTMEHDELEKIEKSMRHTQNDYKRKRKQHDEEERPHRHEQKILRAALQRQHREEAEEEMMLRPQNAEEEAHGRRIILERHKQLVSRITKRLEKLERKIKIQKTAAKVEAGAAGAPEMPQNDGPERLEGMFSQKLDEDFNDVRLRFLSLEP
jgi:hypothetical protein